MEVVGLKAKPGKTTVRAVELGAVEISTDSLTLIVPMRPF